MESLVIMTENEQDRNLLEQITQKMGFRFFEVSDKDKRLLARRKFMEIAKTFPNNFIANEDVNQEIEIVRAKRYRE